MDRYFEDQSKADQIIEEASDKLVGLISEKTKAEIERYKRLYELDSHRASMLQKEVFEQREQIKVLEIDLKKAKEELERKDNEIPKVPFMPGEKVWWVGNDCHNAVTIERPTCQGMGEVETQTADYYEPAKAYSGYVVRTHITLDISSDAPRFVYELVEDDCDLKRLKNKEEYYTFGKYEIYKTEDEAKKAVDQETEKRESEVKKDLCLAK